MNRSTALAGLGCLGLVYLGLAWYHEPQAHSQSGSATPTATASSQVKGVAALARLEPAGKVIKLQVPSARQQDRVGACYVQEGQEVRQGQLLVELDGRPRLLQEVAVARARLEQAQARLGQVLAGAKQGEVERQRGEIERLRAEERRQQQLRRDEVERWKVEELLTRRTYERYRSLYKEGACSALEVEQRQLAWTAAQQQLQQAHNELLRSRDTLSAQIRSAQGELERILEVRPSDVSAAQAEVDASQAEIRRAQVALDECQIVSPIRGTVLKLHTRVGERISSNGLAELAGTQQMVAVAEVYQNDLGRLRKNQLCKLISPALGEPLQGRVERFGGQVIRQNTFSETPGEQFDQRVVEVRIALDEVSSRRASSWTNLQLQALFEAQ